MRSTKIKPPTNPAQGGMTALLSSNAAHAASFTPSDEVLARWYEQQLAAVTAHVAALRTALESLDLDDATLAGYCAVDARYRYSEDTLRLLEAGGHVLSCETHGPFGCGAGLTESEATALAFHGYVAGGDRMEYRRLCEVCAGEQIKAHAASLLHEYRTGKVTT